MIRILKTLAIVAISILLMLFLYPWILRGLGYYVDNTGSEIGRLAAKKMDVSLCNKIIVYSHVLGPPTMSRRGECIYVYAEQTKDPSVCELLMPSSYGLSCVGAASNFTRPCPLGNDRSVSDENGLDATLMECVQGPSSIKNNLCCTVSKARFIKDFNDCSSTSGSIAISDQCYSGLSFKNHDPSTCEFIQDPNIKAGCIVSATGLQKDPSICSGCTPPLNSIEELK